MSTHNVCFLGEIRKYKCFLFEKKKNALSGGRSYGSHIKPDRIFSGRVFCIIMCKVTYLEWFAVFHDVPSCRTLLVPVKSAMVEILRFSFATKIYNISQSNSCSKNNNMQAMHALLSSY